MCVCGRRPRTSLVNIYHVEPKPWGGSPNIKNMCVWRRGNWKKERCLSVDDIWGDPSKRKMEKSGEESLKPCEW